MFYVYVAVGNGRYKTQVSGHRYRSQVSVLPNEYRNKSKHAWKLSLGLIRPKQEFLGLRFAGMNV